MTSWLALWALSMVAAATPAARTTSSSVDCAKATGKIERFVCDDQKLVALDHKLADAYAKALAKAPADRKKLETSQRGWVKVRNNCAATSERQMCVEDAYTQRLSELTIRYGTMVAPKPVTFTCNDDSKILVAFYSEVDVSGAVLTRGEDQVVAPQVRSASGAHYIGGGVDFWNKGDDATVTWNGKQLSCKTK